MTTNILQDMIARCHQRHKKPLEQRKTTVTPLLYKGLPYYFTVYCAHRYPVLLQDLEEASISFMPIGRAPGTDRPPRSFGGERFLKRQEARDWDPIRWHKSWGIHVYTGLPSARDGALWHDIDFKYEAICAAPDTVLACVHALVDAVTNPLLTLSKSGGLRFSCRIPGYLHPNAGEARLYVYKGTPTAENPYQHDAYLEIFGEKGHNCWDARHEILMGDLSDPPVISEEVLFAPIDAFRAALHKPGPQNVQDEDGLSETPYSLGSGRLDLAKEAFFKRGFSYVKHADGLHYWSRQNDEIRNAEVSLWEDEGGVWICSSTPDTGLPMEATLITDVWKDTGILPPIPETGLPIDDKVRVIREGKLSPLSIKRPAPVLHKSNATEKVYETREAIPVEVQRAFNNGVRVLGLIPEADSEKNREVESILRNNQAICLEHFQLFLDPQYAKIMKQLLEALDGTQRLYTISAKRANQLFLKCELSKTTLEEWVVRWQGDALGNLAISLLNAVEIRDRSHAKSIKRLRTVIRTFEWLEEELIQQICYVNIQNRIDTGDAMEAETGEALTRFTIWHQLKCFFAHYTRDTDAPMRWDNEVLQFWVPPRLHPSVGCVLITAPVLCDEHLRRTFLDEKTEVLHTQPRAWVPGNRVFQIRTDVYPRKTILDLSDTWDVLGMSETGQHIFLKIQSEIERDPNIKHGIITHVHAIEQLKGIARNENVCFLTRFRRIEGLETAFQEADVIWIVGMPEMGPRALLERTRLLFGNDEEPLSYEMEPGSHRYKDERVQSVYEVGVFHVFRQMIELAQLNRLANKKIMLITGFRIPEITDRPETLLFDWADIDVAGGLEKLDEVIATRQRFEAERDNLTAESSRKEVERVLGCPPRQANRILQKLRGGKILRVPFREQILALLADGEKKTPEFVAAIQGHPKAINTELTRLVKTGEITKIKRGVYKLPEA
ncbi:MAG: hypothetical protein OXU51_07970 [Candidatus Poribacteria bacterium]|nr:hypothetical protein [Candidatus Poribacteria bacterium]